MLKQPAPAYQGDQPYVFVCYSHEDKALVYPQIIWLQDQDVNVWFDEGISPGQEWSDELGQAIERAESFLVFVTPASVGSVYCRDEIHYAKSHNVPVLAVHLKETVLPPGLELALGASQAVLAYELEDAAYTRKMESALSADGAALQFEHGLVPQKVRRRRSIWIAATFSTLLVVALSAFWVDPDWYADTAPRARSISVLPFETPNQGNDKSPYAATLMRDLRAQIANYPELITIVDSTVNGPNSEASNSSTAASYHLTGSVLKIAEGRQVRAELIRMPDNEIVWTGIYNENERDDPSELASTIGRFVRLQVFRDHQCEAVKQAARSELAAEHTCAAWAENLKFNQGGQADPELMRSNAERAIRLDPSLVDPYSMAGVYYALNLERELTQQASVAKARQLFEQGASLAPDDPFTLFARASSLFIRTDFNYRLAESDLRRAIDLDPLHPAARWFYGALGDSALYQGDLEESLRHYRRATSIYDSDARIWAEFARVLNIAGEHKEALNAAQSALNLVTTGISHWMASIAAVQALIALGDTDSAKRTINDSLKQMPGFKTAWTLDRKRLGMETVTLPELKRMAEVGNPNPAGLFMGYFGLGEKDEAFDWLYKSIDDRNPWIVVGLRLDPFFDGLRGDSRWNEIMRYLEEQEAMQDQ